jgi:hypothetical protein
MNTRKVRAPPCRPLHTISAVLDQLHVVPPFLGSFVVLVLLLVAHYGKAMEILQRKEYMNDRHKIILFVFVVR